MCAHTLNIAAALHVPRAAADCLWQAGALTGCTSEGRHLAAETPQESLEPQEADLGERRQALLELAQRALAASLPGGTAAREAAGA